VKPIEYSIILPAYHEEENLAILLPRLKKTLDKLTIDYEIIVVDACKSELPTQTICAQFDAKCISRTPDNYYGDAVRSGINHASGNYIIFMDADGSHPPEFIKKILPWGKEYDLVIASRYILGGSSENSMTLAAMSKLLNFIYSFLLKVKICDISNSFRLYRTAQLRTLTLKCQNFDIIQEILFGLIRQYPRLKTKEIPFAFKKRLNGESKRSFYIFVASYFKTLFKLAVANFKRKNNRTE
jgi:dolichol-phosphate mannosyltransferase